MTRAVLLSAGGDPFIALMVIKLWQNHWYDEVDKFYINYNNHCGVPVEVAQEFASKVVSDPKVHLIYHPEGVGNGRPITEMTLIAREELVLLLEDDGFIFRSGEVNRCFQLIEKDLTDAVGSPRFSCGTEIGEAAAKKYNLDYSGYGDQGPWFWPNFFFCKREDLLKTDLDFTSKSFVSGEYCKELDHTFKEVNHGDTFVWACIQLRALGLRFHNVPQHKADPYEIESQKKGEMNWHESQQPFKWIHGGSLSTSWGGYLSNAIPDVSNESAMLEMESRVAFWLICSETIKGFDDFRKLYREGIVNLIINSKLSRKRIDQKIMIYKEVMSI